MSPYFHLAALNGAVHDWQLQLRLGFFRSHRAEVSKLRTRGPDAVLCLFLSGGIVLSTDNKNGASFPLLTPMMDTIPPNDTNEGTLFLPNETNDYSH